MKRLSLAIAIAALVIAIPSPVAAGGGATCEYNATNDRVTVSTFDADTAHIGRDSFGGIRLNGSACQGGASVFNTDSILVTGDSDNQTIYVSLANGGFKPGMTNEAGKSDEIEMSILLGGGIADNVVVLGTDAVQKIDLGQSTSQLGTFRLINLNAGETTGVDSDVTMLGVEAVRIEARGGNDVIRARGLQGTGPDVFGLPLYAFGGKGSDIIKGGANVDHLYGDEGPDSVWGYGHDDQLFLQDGVQGNDFGRGGPGQDLCFSDTNDDCDI